MSGIPNNNWTLISSHGLVLLYLGRHPDSTIKQTADAIGLTERRVSELIRDLLQSGLMQKARCGRRNTYSLNPRGHFRHPSVEHLPVGLLLEALAQGASSEEAPQPA